MQVTLLIVTLLNFVPLFAAGDARFNGRWDITARRDTHNAWWLEITGAETDHPAGKFVGFGGNVRTAQDISITPGEITFGFDTPGRPIDKVTCPPKTLPAIIEDSPANRRRGVLKHEEDAA